MRLPSLSAAGSKIYNLTQRDIRKQDFIWFKHGTAPVLT
jgi:hypothetical protein